MRLFPTFLTRYLALTVCAIAVSTADGAVSVLMPPLFRGQGKEAAAIGTLVAVPALIALLMRLPGGALFSERRGPILMVGALVLSGLGAASIPLTSSNLFEAIAAGVYGIGYSLSTTINMALLVSAVEDDPHRGRIVSLYVAGMAFGYALGSFFGGALGDLFGFPTGFAAVGGACAIGLVAAVLNRAAGARREGTAQAGSAPVGQRLAGFGAALLEPTVLYIVSGAFFLNIFLAQFNTFMPLTLLPLGVSLAEIGVIRSLWSLTNAFGRSFGGGILTRLGPRRAQTGGLLLQAVALMVFALPLPVAAYAVLTVVAAFGRATGYVANTVALADVDPRRLSRGLASGLMNAAGDLGKIVGPVTGGLLAEQVGLTSFWLIAPPLFMLAYFGVLAARGLAGRGQGSAPLVLSQSDAVEGGDA